MLLRCGAREDPGNAGGLYVAGASDIQVLPPRSFCLAGRQKQIWRSCRLWPLLQKQVRITAHAVNKQTCAYVRACMHPEFHAVHRDIRACMQIYCMYHNNPWPWLRLRPPYSLMHACITFCFCHKSVHERRCCKPSAIPQSTRLPHVHACASALRTAAVNVISEV